MYRESFEHILRDIIYDGKVKDETYSTFLGNFQRPLIVATAGMGLSFLFSGLFEFLLVLVGFVAFVFYFIYLNALLVELVYYRVWSMAKFLLATYFIHTLLSIPFLVAFFFKWDYFQSMFE